MITLDTTTRTLEVVLAGAVTTSQLPVVVSYADDNETAGTVVNDTSTAQTNGTTAVTALAAPGSGVARVVEYASVYNADTASATVTVRLNDNGTVRNLWKATLSAGQCLQYTRNGGWYDPGTPFAVAASQSGTWNVGTVTTVSALTSVTNVVHVDDNGGSLTVDAPVGTPVFVRLSDGSAAISTLPVSLASVPTHAVTQSSGPWSVDLQKWNTVAVTGAQTLADGLSLPVAPLAGAANLLYNGSTLDLQRANVQGTGLASATRTATTTDSIRVNNNARGVVATLNVTAASGTGGLFVRVYGVTALAGAAQLNADSAGKTAAGAYAYVVYPGATTAQGNVTQATPCPLTERFQLQVVHGDGSNYTYSLTYDLIL